MPQFLKYILVLLLNSSALCCTAQGEATKWLFGNGAGLNFSGSTPSLITGGALTSSLGCASIADAAGNLLFYTDGATVYNQSHTVMANGSGLIGNNAYQSAMILKKPGSANLYYVFSQQISSGLNYSIVDMSLASGSGSVITKNVPLYAGAVPGKMTATKHCNGTDYWLLAVCGNSLCSYALSATGVNTVPVVSTFTNVNVNQYGCMKLSPNGKKLLIASSQTVSTPSMGWSDHRTVLSDYDNTTGIASNSFYISNNLSPYAFFFPYSGEFSPDGTKLYITSSNLFYQYDLCAPVFSLSNVIINSTEVNSDPYVLKRTMQLAPNGKIYICTSPSYSNTVPVSYIGTNSLSVINSPNLLGTNANYVQYGQALGTYTAQWGLPNFPGSFFEQKPSAYFSHTANGGGGCLTASFSPAQVCAGGGYSVTGYQWNFGDPASGAANTSFLNYPSHTYSGIGTYTVRLVRSFQCNNDTLYSTIQITNPSVTISSPTAACGVNTATVQVSGGTGAYTYSWSSGASSAAITVTTGGVYTVTVNDTGGGCSITKTVNIVNTVLSATVNTTALLCHGLSNASAFASVSGGSGVYSYTWNGVPQNTASVANLAGGSYTLSILDQVNLCPLTQTFLINQPAPISPSIVASPTACTGSSMAIWANVTGGTPAYQHNWVGGPASPVYSISQSVAGTYIYTLQVTDANACAASATVAVNFISSPSLNTSNTTLCVGNNVNLTVSGASSYTWQPGGFNGSVYSVNPQVTSVYSVSGGFSACVSQSTLLVTVYPLPTLMVSSNSPLCEGQTLLFTTGSNGNSFLWQGPNQFSSNSQNPGINSTSLINTGNYTLQVTDANGCSSNSVLPVNVMANPALTVSSTPSLLCVGQAATLSATGALSYNWSNGANTFSTTVNPVATIFYTVTGNQINGCSRSYSLMVEVSKCLGLANNAETVNELEIFPNPASGLVNVVCHQPMAIHISNALGQLVIETQLQAGMNQIDLSSLSSGYYTLQSYSGSKPIRYKLVVKP